VTSAPATMRTTVSAGTVGSGMTLSCPANRSHSARPSAMPSGTPTMAPTVIAAVDCQATVADSWRLVNPRVLSSARSLRRRRTEDIRVSSSELSAPSTRAPARITGAVPIDR
jgi:hypothetical protein